MRTRPGLLAVPAALAAMTALCLAPSPSASASASDAPPERPSATVADTHQVTLVTGERIKVDEYSDGMFAGTVLPGEDGVAPQIATYRSGTADEPGAPPGSTATTSLPSIDGLALGVSKKQARTFWEAVDDDRTKSASTRLVLADGIEKIWLDKPVKVALDTSVPQIGAPEA
ncbi:hypothetical protein ACIBO4_04815 [Streptomyces sp. NPDC050149]|uniref:hypothetical protein n=1 Tax=Streptomyces sp. NPDC050149 TaxID=3365603 RepID=UPI00378F3E95